MDNGVSLLLDMGRDFVFKVSMIEVFSSLLDYHLDCLLSFILRVLRVHVY